ncbi:hypothetical protein PRK78_000168 [Emydomyces testavorans]|uniref:Uncharacterized protein n=1 Tax=Emydomyces testavorans TaxID=2070801 RepID=A0AAF0DAH1_9EURO|nr:hypothetical protein PRK78_000168 [Emydomyces testavorans]
MHLNGLYSILRHRKTIQNQTPVASELIATIGFLDLPSHIVGRQTPTLNIWRDYCRGRSGTEPASGMPYNLLDIFSLIAEPDAEWHFWSWNTKDLDTTSVNYMLWDVTRLAGIIVAREYRRCSSGHIGPCDHASGGMFSSPSTEELVERIFSQLERLYQLSADVVRSTVNLLLFPAFTVGAQHSILSLKQKAFLEDFWTVFFFEDDTGSPHLQMPLKILRELWVNPCRRSADQIAQDWEVEVGLF